jgi:hypothetical protein
LIIYHFANSMFLSVFNCAGLLVSAVQYWISYWSLAFIVSGSKISLCWLKFNWPMTWQVQHHRLTTLFRIHFRPTKMAMIGSLGRDCLWVIVKGTLLVIYCLILCLMLFLSCADMIWVFCFHRLACLFWTHAMSLHTPSWHPYFLFVCTMDLIVICNIWPGHHLSVLRVCKTWYLIRLARTMPSHGFFLEQLACFLLEFSSGLYSQIDIAGGYCGWSYLSL